MSTKEVDLPIPPNEPRAASGFVCGEIRGGNEPIHERVAMPGLRGVLYSNPCRGASGGDLHYISVCGSGLLARVCLADVAGHGEMIAAVGAEMHALLRRSVDTIDERKVLTTLDRRLDDTGPHAMTTAVLLTYYPPARRLTVRYAGHPPGWLYRAGERRWSQLDTPTQPTAGRHADLPLGTGLSPTFTRHRFRVAPGDRLLLVTDGVLEASAPDGRELGAVGLAALLERSGDRLDSIDQELLAALRAHVDHPDLVHDDVTFFAGEFVPGPPGPALWHIVKNRLLSRSVQPEERQR